MHAILKALPAQLQQLQEKKDKDKEKDKEKEKEKEASEKEKPNNWTERLLHVTFIEERS